MKVAIVGSRTFDDYTLLYNTLKEITNIELIVSGGARGADSLAESWAKVNKTPVKIFLPNWDKFGKSAGFKRNVQIVENCDLLIAFWDGKSKGTEHSINLAKQMKKDIKIIYFQEK